MKIINKNSLKGGLFGVGCLIVPISLVIVFFFRQPRGWDNLIAEGIGFSAEGLFLVVLYNYLVKKKEKEVRDRKRKDLVDLIAERFQKIGTRFAGEWLGPQSFSKVKNKISEQTSFTSDQKADLKEFSEDFLKLLMNLGPTITGWTKAHTFLWGDLVGDCIKIDKKIREEGDPINEPLFPEEAAAPDQSLLIDIVTLLTNAERFCQLGFEDKDDPGDMSYHGSKMVLCGPDDPDEERRILEK